MYSTQDKQLEQLIRTWSSAGQEKFITYHIKCRRCDVVYSKGLQDDQDPMTVDEVMVRAYLDGWFIVEKDKYCLACVKSLAHKFKEHVLNLPEKKDA